MSVLYSGTGDQYVLGQGTVIPNYDAFIKGVNHRGYRAGGAAENTLAAFRASKLFGFNYGETDLRFTSDGVGVLNHDGTAGGLTISSNTYADLVAADPTLARFDDFIELCRKIIYHPYIEIKAGNATQLSSAVAIVKAHGMLRNCTWISFDTTDLSNILLVDNGARIGLLASGTTAEAIAAIVALKTSDNEVFLDVNNTGITSEGIASCISNNLPIEAWTIDVQATILSLDSYITGVTSNTLIAGKVLYDSVY